MANAFLPRSKVWLSSQPFDGTSENRLWFTSETNKLSYFTSTSQRTIPPQDSEGVALTWVQVGRTVKLPVTYNEAMTYNYMVIRETEAGGNTVFYYCFITGVEYDNPATTIFSIQLDTLTTYMNALTFHQCLVERETTASDELFEHRLPEGISVGDYEIYTDPTGVGSINLSAASINDIQKNYYLCFITCGENAGNVVKIHDTTANVNAPAPYSGGNVNAGCYYWAWDTIEDALEDIGWVSGSRNVGNAFIIPPEEVVGITLVPREHNEQGSAAAFNDFLAKDPNNIYSRGSTTVFNLMSRGVRPRTDSYSTLTYAFGDNDFTPKNKKLYCYPYCYTSLYLSSNGEERFFWNEKCPRKFTGYPQLHFISCFSLSPTPALAVWAEEYNGERNAMNNAVTFNNFQTIPYACDGFQQYWAQHKGAITAGWIASLAGVGSSVASIRGAFDSQMAVSEAAKVSGDSLLTRRMEVTAAGASITKKAGYAALALNAVGTAIQAKGQYDDLNNIPDQRYGAQSDAIVQQIESNPFHFRRYHLKLEELQRIDEYFSNFGYYINKFKVPDLTGRPCWNYVKTAGCTVSGAIPLEAKIEIQGMFDNGIRLWHDPELYMDFTQDNSPS